MSANQRDYFEQKSGLDLKPFFEAKGIKMDKAEQVTAAAPPPKGHAWVENIPTPEEEEEE